MKKVLISSILVIISFTDHFGQNMDFKTLKLTLAQRATIITENTNSVEYETDGIHIYLITDENANRMRLMAGIVEENKLTKQDFMILMKANFDRALDAKYALSNGILWSVFVHPLKELDKEQIVDALYQVKNLVSNYGSSYASTDVVFGSDN